MLKTKSKITYHKPRYGDQERFVNELKKSKIILTGNLKYQLKKV